MVDDHGLHVFSLILLNILSNLQLLFNSGSHERISTKDSHKRISHMKKKIGKREYIWCSLKINFKTAAIHSFQSVCGFILT